MNVRFIYLRDEHKHPVSCLAVAYDKDLNKVSYGVSTLNPVDTFNRKVARYLAAGCLTLKPTTIQLFVPPDSITSHYITTRIMHDLMRCDSDELPSRSKKAAKRWLKLAQAKRKEIEKQEKEGKML